MDLGLMGKYREFLRLSVNVASFSNDPSTQIGAVLITPAGTYVAEDFNQFPAGVSDKEEDRWRSPVKYAYIEHAERNVIYRAGRCGIKTKGLVMVCHWAACADCARAIIQAGIIRLVRQKASRFPPTKWEGSCRIGDTMMREAGIDIIDIDEQIGTRSIRRDGELICP